MLFETIRRVVRRGFRSAGLPAAALVALAGCAGVPERPIAERVDERTAVNVVTLARPLLYSRARGGPLTTLDLFVAPVEVNRMGERTYYLWTSLLGDVPGGGSMRLRLVAAGEVLLEPAPLPPGRALPVSVPPYEAPASWAVERYFTVTPEELARLRGHPDLRPEIAGGAGQWLEFDPWEVDSAGLDAFITEQLALDAGTGGT